MNLRVNGAEREVPEGTSVAALLEILAMRRDLVAVEVNRELVRRADHDARILADGDRVEVVEFVGGG